jgi:hypothetical protein
MGNASPFFHTQLDASIYDVENTPLFSDKIKDGARELQKSSRLRTLFVAFVFNKRWMRDILHHRTLSFFPHIAENGLSSRIFYHMPNGGFFYVPKTETQGRNTLLPTHSDGKDGSWASTVDPTSLSPANAGLLVLTILLPLFMKTANYRTHFDEEFLHSSRRSQESSSLTSSCRRVRTMVAHTAQTFSHSLAETSLHWTPKYNHSLQDEDDGHNEDDDEEEITVPTPSNPTSPKAHKLNVLTTPPKFPSTSASVEDRKSEFMNQARANLQENRSVLEDFFHQTIHCLQQRYYPLPSSNGSISAHENGTNKEEEIKSENVASSLEELLASGTWLVQVLRFLDELKYSISLAWSSDSHYFTSSSHQHHHFNQPSTPKRTISKNFRQDLDPLASSPSFASSTSESSLKHSSSVYRTLPSSPLFTSSPKVHHPHAFSSSFPLCYVNQSFEALTQWSRTELYGQSARCLHSEEVTEMQQVERVKEALHALQPTKLAITNLRRDGSSFVNLLALKPVVLCASDLPQFHQHNHSHNNHHLKMQSPKKNRSDTVGTAVIGLQYDFHRMKQRTLQQQQQKQPFNSNSMAEDLEAIDLLLNLLPLLIT